MMKADKIVSLRRGKSYTTSSRQTPPGSEGSKGKMVERCDIRGLPFFILSLPEFGTTHAYTHI